VETGATVRPLRHRQTKGAETDTPDLTSTAPHSYSTANLTESVTADYAPLIRPTGWQAMSKSNNRHEPPAN